MVWVLASIESVSTLGGPFLVDLLGLGVDDPIRPPAAFGRALPVEDVLADPFGIAPFSTTKTS